MMGSVRNDAARQIQRKTQMWEEISLGTSEATRGGVEVRRILVGDAGGNPVGEERKEGPRLGNRRPEGRILLSAARNGLALAALPSCCLQLQVYV
mmetsp:Transcript_32935/g.44601  ORF Transcript_32935/g.44601 Transcript_32935/m.44601 type:complete len:95 (-) Transcript_32935:352-636(-)